MQHFRWQWTKQSDSKRPALLHHECHPFHMAGATTKSLISLPSTGPPVYDPALVPSSGSSIVQPSTSMQQATTTLHPSDEHPSLASLKSLKSSMTSRFEAPPLTGAAALEDIRLEKERQRHRGRDSNQSLNHNTINNPADATSAVSMNPAASAKAALQGNSLDFGTSRPSEAPIRITAPPTLKDAANHDNVPRTMQLDIRHPTSGGLASSSDDKTSTIDLRVMESHTAQPTTATPRQNDVSIEDVGAADQSPDDAHMQTPLAGQPSGSLSRSSLSTSSSKKHKCPYCETEFTRHHNLKSHLLTHSQEKPYECATCQAKFRRLHDLKRHTKLHTGERPHTCSKCGRRFARGDALARHNKGPGGCANGRRGSFGDEDGDGGDDSMEGVVYQDDHGSDSREEDEGNSRKRRRSEPSTGERQDDLQAAQSTGASSYRISSSTYPGTAATANMTGNYPGNSTMLASPQDTSVYPPPPNGTSSYSSQYNNGPTSIYGRGTITDSPRHLSPEADSSRFPMSEAASLRGRSASLTSHYQQQQQYRPGSMGTPSIPLPSLGNHSGPQLPSLVGLASDSRNNHFAASSPAGTKSSLPPYTSLPPPDNASNSSGQRSSSSSMREILRGANMPEHVEFMEYVRSLEAKVSRLETEVTLLREHQPQHSTQASSSQLPQPPASR